MSYAGAAAFDAVCVNYGAVGGRLRRLWQIPVVSCEQGSSSLTCGSVLSPD